MSNSGFEEGCVYESRHISGDVFLVTRVMPIDNADCDDVHFVWLAADTPYIVDFLGHEHSFVPDRRSFELYKRVS